MVRLTFEEKEKLALEYLNLKDPPLCYCGNKVKFISKYKTHTPYGSWRTYCSRLCMQRCPKLNARKNETKKTTVYKTPRPLTPEQRTIANEKAKQTYLRKYGVEHFSKSQEYLDKREATNLERYGVKNTWALVKNPNYFLQSPEGKEWLKNNPKSPESFVKGRRTRMLKRIKDIRIIEAIIELDSLSFENLLHEYACSNPSRKTLAKAFGISSSWLNNLMRQMGLAHLYCSERGSSHGEREVAKFVEDLGFNVVKGPRSILKGQKELDIYIPSHNLAIEFNGIFWHSSAVGKDASYHLQKTEECEAKGIQLLHIWDIEWYEKSEIWKSIILEKLGLSPNTIDANDCSLCKLLDEDAEEFLEEYQLSNIIEADEYYGLVYEDELVAVISIENNVLKICNKTNYKLENIVENLCTEFRGLSLSLDRRSHSSLEQTHEYTIKEPTEYFIDEDYELVMEELEGVHSIYDSGEIIINLSG